MQDPPTASELLESVRHFLETEVVPAAPDARLRFRSLVAANVLSIVLRESELADGFLRAEETRLSALLGVGGGGEGRRPSEDPRDRVAELNRELARRIRSEEIDAAPGSPAWSAMRRTVVEKLEIANPGYLKRIGEADEDR